ncbi:hypothetical protein HY479_02450 [Candidatus Uhrbacteria bacterium]|nr:hypothetical protein [Candidatus Uhrbacteria bacterium]
MAFQDFFDDIERITDRYRSTLSSIERRQHERIREIAHAVEAKEVEKIRERLKKAYGA